MTLSDFTIDKAPWSSGGVLRLVTMLAALAAGYYGLTARIDMVANEVKMEAERREHMSQIVRAEVAALNGRVATVEQLDSSIQALAREVSGLRLVLASKGILNGQERQP